MGKLREGKLGEALRTVTSCGLDNQKAAAFAMVVGLGRILGCMQAIVPSQAV